MKYYYAAAALLITGAALLAFPQTTEELDSIKVCAATQKLIFENAFVRIIDDRIPPGVTEPKHQHKHGVTISISAYDLEQVIYPEGRVVKGRREGGGAANWSEAIIHTVKNTGTTESHTVRIELK